MLEPKDFQAANSGDEVLLRVIAYAVSIAPCVDHLPETGALRNRVIAVLQGVVKQVRSRGTANLRAQRVDTASVDYFDVGSFFATDDRNALAAVCKTLCGGRPSGLPRGSFPKPHAGLSRVFPEER